ncbi:MAG: S41 family peptidase [Spirochaetes bacterium]|nr:S41 family peptidase [Spirochaetota bacterium]
MISKKERIIWVAVVVFVIAISFINIYRPSRAGAQERGGDNDFYRYMTLFQNVYNSLQENFVDSDKVSAKKLITGAIKGMLEAVDDPFTMLMDDKLTAELNSEMAGEFGGLGIVLGMNDDSWLTVTAPIEDTPAERIGVHGGDIISEIDGKTTKGMSIEQAVKILRGKPGTKVTITVVREGEDEPLRFTITRAIINIKSVKYQMLPGPEKTGYVRITTFGDKTLNELKAALADLNQNGMKRIIVDLRNNPGGRLDTAFRTVDLFVSQGKIVYTRGRNPQQNSDFYAQPNDDLCIDIPMIVLVNKYSASASEIFAGAIRDNKRGVLVGEKTFGKFSVQQVLPLDPKNNVTYKMTIAKYYTPLGRSLHKEGLPPDYTADEEQFSKEDMTAVRKIREGKFISEYMKQHPKADADAVAIPKLAATLSTSCIKVRQELLERMIAIERGRAESYKRVVDLKYDRQLQYSMELIGKPATFDYKKLDDAQAAAAKTNAQPDKTAK